MKGTPNIENRFETLVFREAHGGRSRLAAALDSLLAALFSGLGLYIAYRPRLKSRFACVIAVFATLAAFGAFAALFSKRRGERTRERLIDEGRGHAARLRLMKDPSPAFARLRAREGVLAIEKTDVFTADDLREALGGKNPAGLKAVSLAKPTEGAKELLDVLGMELASFEEVSGAAELSEYAVSDGEAMEAALVKYEAKYRKTRPLKGLKTLIGERGTKFTGVGAGLMLMSLFARYSLYYRLMGGLALSIGAWSFALGRLKAREGITAPG